MRHEIDAINHAVHHPAEPNTELAALGYRRWIDRSGSVRVLQSRPFLGGPWREESLEGPSAILPRLRRSAAGSI